MFVFLYVDWRVVGKNLHFMLFHSHFHSFALSTTKRHFSIFISVFSLLSIALFSVFIAHNLQAKDNVTYKTPKSLACIANILKVCSLTPPGYLINFHRQLLSVAVNIQVFCCTAVNSFWRSIQQYSLCTRMSYFQFLLRFDNNF